LIRAIKEDPLNSAHHFDDPVAAYSRLASHYGDLSQRREAYLRSIEKIIVSRIPKGCKSLLDIGAGDGSRTLRIARECGIQNIVLIEPSQEMAAPAAGMAKIWNIRAEELCARDRLNRSVNSQVSAPFDVITCLWNVLGHIHGFENRVRAMRAMHDLLTTEGKCFIDVNHRYNLRSYGFLTTAARFISDSIFYEDANADVVAKWDIGGESLSTYGHVFIDREIRQLASAAGLSIEQRIVVNYDNGQIRHFAFSGNLLYAFRRSSDIDSLSAPQTS
jgi:SAM-dependent methyltransferase